MNAQQASRLVVDLIRDLSAERGRTCAVAAERNVYREMVRAALDDNRDLALRLERQTETAIVLRDELRRYTAAAVREVAA
jgi:hypothetical protein